MTTLRSIAATQTCALRVVGLPGLSDHAPQITLESPDGLWKLHLPRSLFNFPTDVQVMAAVTLMAVQVVEEDEPPVVGPTSKLILPGGRAN